jgi:nucleoside-diphosphate-sugar epimerase
MRKVLVVGGAGYIGAVVCQELLDRGYAVKVLDRLYYGEDGLRPIRDRVELVIDDMRTVEPAVLDDVDAVVNLGGLSNDPTAEFNPRANTEMNTVATVTLAELCRARGVQRYVFASTCSVYDTGVGTEEQDVLLDEDAELSPRAAYARSKFDAERQVLALASDGFCPVVFRKGTVYGFSPRMRYDLVVNTFVRDALARGVLTLHYGGEMWRPLLDVRDAARAYVLGVEADEALVRRQIFNLSYRNLRISELALRIREVFRDLGTPLDVRADFSYRSVRSYRVRTTRIERALGFRPVVSIEESVRDMVARIREFGYTDFDNPRYYNIRWMKTLEEAERVIAVTGSVFHAPAPAGARAGDGAGAPGPAAPGSRIAYLPRPAS